MPAENDNTVDERLQRGDELKIVLSLLCCLALLVLCHTYHIVDTLSSLGFSGRRYGC